MPPRRLWALLHSLPSDAAVWRTQDGWSHQDEMAALAVEQINACGRAVALLLAGEGATLPGPLSIVRPIARDPDPSGTVPRETARTETAPRQRRPNPTKDFGAVAAWFARN